MGSSAAKSKKSSSKNPDVLEDLKTWIKELERGEQGHSIQVREFERFEANVADIRNALKLTRQEFASRFGLSLRTVENWEDHRREPEGPAKCYLIAIAFAPNAVADAIRSYRNGKIPRIAPEKETDPAPYTIKEEERMKKLMEKSLRPVGQFTMGNADFAIVPLAVQRQPQVHFDPLLQAAKYLVQHPQSDKGRRQLEAAVEMVEADNL